ncbi:MAG: DHHW family protein [Bacteroidetes bacterium]|nr:DHHW family protein [Bacteroidota bacterium]
MVKKLEIVLVFIGILAISTLFFATPKQKISLSEKRTLSTLPAFTWDNYISGEFTKGINLYINDHFPFRAQAVRFTEAFRYNLGFRLQDQEKIVVVGTPKKVESPESPLDSAAAKNFLEGIDEAYSGSMLILDGKVYPQNAGDPGVSPYFAKMLNLYADSLQGKARIFSAVAPLSSAFIPLPNYERYAKRNEETLLAIKNNLNPGVYFADVLGEMNQHYNEYLWYGSDHHWTGLGAYYGYVAFCKAAGIMPVPLSSMEKKEKSGFLGSLYELTRDQTVRDNPDRVETYIPPGIETEAVRYNPYDFKYPQKTRVFCNSANYSTFICGDAPMMKITTNVKNGKKIAVVKNSMGNAFVVYLISHYEEIYVVDFRYSKHNLLKIIKDAQVNDLVFALGIYGAVSRGTIGMMRNLAYNKNQNYADVLKREEEQRILDSINGVQDSVVVQNQN